MPLRRRSEIIEEIVQLDLEEADWRRRLDDCDTELAALRSWGGLILERRHDLIRELRRCQRASELRNERGL